MSYQQNNDVINKTEISQIFMTRELFYKLFANIFYDVIQNDSQLPILAGNLSALEKMLGTDKDKTALANAFINLNRVLHNDKKTVELLAREYTKSFLLGIYSVPISASPYFSPNRTVFQEERKEVKKIYVSSGLEINSGQKKIPEDHLAVELSFIQLMTEKAANSIGDKSTLINNMKQQSEFLSEHLLPLICAVTEASLKKGNTGFYTDLLCVLQEYVNQDLNALEYLLDEESLCLI